MAATTLESIEQLERDVEAEKECWLSARGWRRNCNLPDSIWRWEKQWKGTIIVLDMESALSVQKAMETSK